MKSLSIFPAMRSLFMLVLLLGAAALSAQNSDKSREKAEEENKESIAESDSAKQAAADSANARYLSVVKRYTLGVNKVLYKPSWHVGIIGGFHFDYFNYAAQKTSFSETTLDSNITNTSTSVAPIYKKSPGIGLKFGVVCHPYIGDYVAIGVHCDGAVGTTPLFFVGGGSFEREATHKYSNETKYFYGNLNYGIELTAGFAWLKFLTAYDHSLRHTDLSYFEDGYSSGAHEFIKQNGEYKIKMELRHEELTFGVRLFPYSKEKLRIQYPCLLDLTYTLNRDYDFAWKNSAWNYRGINDFYHGFKVNLWVESIIGLSVNVSFPKNYYKAKDEPVNIQSNKTLPFIGVSLFYNKDFFGRGYK